MRSPYAYRPSLEYKTTSYGGYGYGFTGPNLNLKPEFATSYEFGAELSFLNDRLGVDVTRVPEADEGPDRQRHSRQLRHRLRAVQPERRRDGESGPRGDGCAAPRSSKPFVVGHHWRTSTSRAARCSRCRTHSRSPTSPTRGSTATCVTARRRDSPRCRSRACFYLRNNAGQDPHRSDIGSAAPVHGTFIDAGYDRQPDCTMGLPEHVPVQEVRPRLPRRPAARRRRVQRDRALPDHARPGARSTLDRETPRVIDGVLRDGKENTTNPTKNTIVVIPPIQTTYYTGMSEELFIEKNINWVRLRDVTLSYALPERIAHERAACSSPAPTCSSSPTTQVSIRSSNGNVGGSRRLGWYGHRLRQLPDPARHQLRPPPGL